MAEAREGAPRMTPEEIRSAKIQEGRMISDDATVDAEGRLNATEAQKGHARKEMEADFLARDLEKTFDVKELERVFEAIRQIALYEGYKAKDDSEKQIFRQFVTKVKPALEILLARAEEKKKSAS
ncbi:MAG: hypothetical protein HY397_03800 [Candidatus Doudnabacteria bacterium]|nr:hypothetical protein [Candidatus Doudnabacteria bacterium]